MPVLFYPFKCDHVLHSLASPGLQSAVMTVIACHRVMVQGAGPSARYAHTLALVANRFLVAMGGNDGKQTLSDAWALDTSDKPYQWKKITDAGEQPSSRCDALQALGPPLSSKTSRWMGCSYVLLLLLWGRISKQVE